MVRWRRLAQLTHAFPFSAHCLVDSGSSHCYVDKEYTRLRGLCTYDVSPLRLRYLDGTTSVITNAVSLHVRLASGEVPTVGNELHM